jgi:hypothetical protein
VNSYTWQVFWRIQQNLIRIWLIFRLSDIKLNEKSQLMFRFVVHCVVYDILYPFYIILISNPVYNHPLFVFHSLPYCISHFRIFFNWTNSDFYKFRLVYYRAKILNFLNWDMTNKGKNLICVFNYLFVCVRCHIIR